MDKAIKSNEYEFQDMRPAESELISFVSEDYTEATVGDTSRFVGHENYDEIKDKMKESFSSIHENYDENNLNYIKETIAKEKEALEIAIDGLDKIDKDVLKKVFDKNKPANNPFCMFMDESGNGKSPKITEESRKNNAKTLIKALNSTPTKENK